MTFHRRKFLHLAAGVAELYEPVSEEKGLDFAAELSGDLSLRGNRDFLAQALALKTTADVTTVDGGNIAAALR